MKIFNPSTGAFNTINAGDKVYYQGRIYVCINSANCPKFDPSTNETVWKLTNIKGIEDTSKPAPAITINPESPPNCLLDNLNPTEFTGAKDVTYDFTGTLLSV